MQSRRFIRIASLFLMFLTVLYSSQAHQAAAQSDITYAADTGFRPASDGFNFQNYGADEGYQNLTPAEVRILFGDQVCASLNGDVCVLTPPGQEWMEKINKDMDGGHCDGMAALSSLFYIQKEHVNDFGGTKPFALTISDNQKLQHEIARWWATQTTVPGNQQDVKGTPNEILARYIKDTTDKTEAYTAGIAQPDGSQGHSITPYAVEDKGGGIAWLMVYDNNYPGQEQHIEIDKNANTWKYTTSSDPTKPEAEYKGDATTQSLTLTPDSARTAKQQCPFCEAQSAKTNGLALLAMRYNQIWVAGSNAPGNYLNVLITDEAGHKLGHVDGKFINEIPNAYYVAPKSGNLYDDSIEPFYNIPAGIKFTVALDGASLKQAETAEISMIGAGYDLGVEDIQMKPGDHDELSFSPNGGEFTYKPSSSEAPNLVIGVQQPTADYLFEVKGFELDPGASVSVNLALDQGTLSVGTNNATNPAKYGLVVNRITETSDLTFSHDGVDLAPDETAYIEFGKWDGTGDLPIGIDAKNDGTIENTVPEANQQK